MVVIGVVITLTRKRDLESDEAVQSVRLIDTLRWEISTQRALQLSAAAPRGSPEPDLPQPGWARPPYR